MSRRYTERTANHDETKQFRGKQTNFFQKNYEKRMVRVETCTINNLIEKRESFPQKKFHQFSSVQFAVYTHISSTFTPLSSTQYRAHTSAEQQ